MKHSFAVTLIAAALFASGGAFAQGSINQNQSGNNNNQSISIGNSDGKPAKKVTKAKKSVQKDDSGNVQSSDVSGSTGGNVSQNQSGNSNKQSISIGGGTTTGKLPTVTQSQQGSGKEQSIVVDGKKVEKSQK